MGVVIRQSIKGTIVNYVGAFIGFLTTMFLVTKFLQPEEIGLTKVMLEVALLVTGFAQLGTSASAFRFFPYFRNPSNGNNGFFFYMLLLPTIGFLIFVPLYLLFGDLICDFFQHNSALFVDYYYWVLPLVFFLLYWTVFESYSTLMMRIVIPKLIREVGLRLMLIGVYLLYAFGVMNLDGLVFGFIGVYGLAMLAAFFNISHITPLTLAHDFSFVSKSLRQKIAKYTLFLIVGALGGGIVGKLDLFMVSSQMGLDFAGIYAIAFYMATVIEIPARSIASISSPIAATALKDGDFNVANELYKKVSLHQLLAGSSIFVMIWINIDNIFAIIPNGAVYSQGKWAVFFIGLSKLIEITLNFGGTMISFSKYYYWGLYFTFFITGLTILTNYLLIPVFGLTGAAMATALTCLISYSVQQWLVLIKIKGNPYTRGTLKQIIVILLLFGCNALLPRWSDNPLVDSCYRTILIGLLWLFLIYTLRISSEICQLIDKWGLKR